MKILKFFQQHNNFYNTLLHIHTVQRIHIRELPCAAAVFYCWPLSSSGGAVGSSLPWSRAYWQWLLGNRRVLASFYMSFCGTSNHVQYLKDFKETKCLWEKITRIGWMQCEKKQKKTHHEAVTLKSLNQLHFWQRSRHCYLASDYIIILLRWFWG